MKFFIISFFVLFTTLLTFLWLPNKIFAQSCTGSGSTCCDYITSIYKCSLSPSTDCTPGPNACNQGLDGSCEYQGTECSGSVGGYSCSNWQLYTNSCGSPGCEPGLYEYSNSGCSYTPGPPTGGYGCVGNSCQWTSWGTLGPGCGSGCGTVSTFCGDYITNGSEACDDGPSGSTSCTSSCARPSYCGTSTTTCSSSEHCCGNSCVPLSQQCTRPGLCDPLGWQCTKSGDPGEKGHTLVPGAGVTGCIDEMAFDTSTGQLKLKAVKSDGSPCSANWSHEGAAGDGPQGGLSVWKYEPYVQLSDLLRPNYPGFPSKTFVGVIPNYESEITLPTADIYQSHYYLVTPACVTNINWQPYYLNSSGSDTDTSEIRWKAIKDSTCYRLPSYTPPVQRKNCSISISPSGTTQQGTPVTVTVSGGASWPTTDTVRLFLEQTNSTSPPIDFTTTPDPYSTGNTSAPYYYHIPEADCTFTNGQSCTKTVALSGLPPGGYYLHCDVATEPAKCSGNPYCTYEGFGGPYTCTDWESCSNADNVNFAVEEAAPPAPTNLSAVCNAAVAGQFLPTAITLSWDIVSQANSYLIKVTDGVAGDNINALNAADTSITYADKIDCATTGTTDPDVCIRVSASINSIALNVDPDTFAGATWSVQAENTGGLSPVTTGSNIAQCSKTFTISGEVKVGRALASGDSCTNLGSVAWNDAQPITVEVVNTSESPPILLGSDTTSNGAYSISVTAPNGANLTTRLAASTNTGSVKVQCTNSADTATISWSYIPTRTNHIARIDSAGYCNSTTNGISTWIPWYCGALGDQYVNNAGSCQDNLCTLTRNIIADQPYWSADIEPFEGAVGQSRIKSASFICPSYPLDTVAYAVQCPSSGGFNFVSDGTNKSNLNIYVNNEFDPWWQVAGGNVFSYNPLAVYIPDDTCSAAFPSCDPYLITKELLSPSYSRLATRNSMSAGIPISAVSVYASTGGPLRTASYLTERSQQTKAGQAGTPSPTETYSYFKNLLNPSVSGHTLQSNAGFIDTIDSLADIMGATAVNGTELYYSSTSLTITPATTIAVPNTRKIIVFVEGDLTINGGSVPGAVTSVAPGGNLIFIVNGTITVAGTVGQVSESSTTPSLQGVFIGNFLTIASAAPSTELKFVGAGTFVGQFGVTLLRDFSGNANGANRTSPTELFIFRPDFVTNWPELLKTATINWKELE